MTDLSGLDLEALSSEPMEMPLLHPGTLEPTGAVLLVLGYDSQRIVDAAREFDRAAMKNAAELTKEPGILSKKRKLHLARAALVGWSGFIWEGAEKPYNKEFADHLMARTGFSWIEEQITAHGSIRRNLFPEAPKD
jgi:hypothetical protein